MHVLHIDTGKALRGGQRQLLLLARGLQKRGHRQLVVCPEDSVLEARAHREGLEVFALPSHDPAHVHGIMQLRRLLLVDPFRILHAHDGQGQTIGWLASWGMPVRRVASRRVTFLPRGLAGGRVIHRLKYQFTCHGIVAVSHFVSQLLAQCGIPATMIEVIPDGVELPRELPDALERSWMRAQWGLGEEDFVIGHLTGAAEKGQDTALEAFGLLAQSVPSACMLLAGEGSGRWSALTTLANQWPPRHTGISPMSTPVSIPSCTPLGNARGSEALLSRGREEAVVKSQGGGQTSLAAPQPSSNTAVPSVCAAASVPSRIMRADARGALLSCDREGAVVKTAASQAGRICLLGPIEDLTGFFAAVDLYIMPSRAEGLGSSALLAMAHGIPVVATRVGGLPEVVEDGRTGWLVPAGSPAALAESIISAASDRARLRAFGQQGRERAKQYATDIMVERTEALYHRVVASG